MGSIQRYIRERKRDRMDDEAREFKRMGKFADAAQAYMRKAENILAENELIYSGDSIDAFEMWMQAGEISKAMEQARNALKGYSHGDWLTNENSYLDNLVDLVQALNRAGYTDEADIFFNAINDHLISIGKEPITIALWGTPNKFPAECSDCGGAITYRGNKSRTECPYCKGVVHAL